MSSVPGGTHAPGVGRLFLDIKARLNTRAYTGILITHREGYERYGLHNTPGLLQVHHRFPVWAVKRKWTMTTTVNITEAPAVTLSNGLRVANFSSPHPFNFVDGSVLPACDEERSRTMSMDRADEETPWTGPLFGVRAPIQQVKPKFLLNEATLVELQAAHESWDVDIVLVPFPLLQALQAGGSTAAGIHRFPKVATVIMADRITKAAAIDRFGR